MDAWWQPTDRKTVSQVLKLLELESGDLVYDLGCGDGRFLIKAVKDYRARAIGIEIDPVRVIVTWFRIILSGTHSGASVVLGNMYKVDLTKADAVVLFLSGEANEKLAPKLERELQPGTRIASYYHELPGWTPVKQEHNQDDNPIYIYQN